MNIDTNLVDKLRSAQQEHLLNFFDMLSEKEQLQYAEELANLDLELLQSLIQTHVLQKPAIALPEKLEPAPYFPLNPRNKQEADYYKQADAAGTELLSAGKVAALTVAGGQGSRLGFDGPKGTYPIAPVSGKTLFHWS